MRMSGMFNSCTRKLENCWSRAECVYSFWGKLCFGLNRVIVDHPVVAARSREKKTCVINSAESSCYDLNNRLL